jgi:hypothetical protein
MSQENVSKKPKSPQNHNGFLATAKSVSFAFFGVQSNKNRERDFSQGKLSHFIIAGLLGAILFISALIAVVSLVLP